MRFWFRRKPKPPLSGRKEAEDFIRQLVGQVALHNNVPIHVPDLTQMVRLLAEVQARSFVAGFAAAQKPEARALLEAYMGERLVQRVRDGMLDKPPTTH